MLMKMLVVLLSLLLMVLSYDDPDNLNIQPTFSPTLSPTFRPTRKPTIGKIIYFITKIILIITIIL